MKTYSSYKSSGVTYLGSIPSHWNAVRLRFRVKLNPSASQPLEPQMSVTFLPMASISEEGVVDLEQKRKVEEVSTGYTYFEDGDVAIAKITPCFENGKGCVMTGLYNRSGFGTTELIVMRPDDTIEPRWLYYLTKSDVFRLPGEAFMQGAGGQKRVPDLFVKDFFAAVPPLHEQCAVASYLDNETARIDELLKEKDDLVTLLLEARVSLVTEVISGEGLAGSYSGNKWAPHLPMGWELKKLKHLGQLRSGLTKGKDSEGKATVELPYLRVANVQNGYLDLSEISTIPVQTDAVERYALNPGDVLINEGGDYDKVGRGAVWRGEISPCLHQNHVFAFRPLDLELSEWISAITETQYAKYYFMNNAKQSTN